MWPGHRVREGEPLGGMWGKRAGLGPTVEGRRRRRVVLGMLAELDTRVELGMPAELDTRVELGMPAELGRRVVLGMLIGPGTRVEGSLRMRLWLKAVGG